MDQEKNIRERRKYVRLQASVEVKYEIIGKPGEIKVFSKDISAGGLCIVTKENLSPDTPLQLEIVFPDLKDPIRALARVIWQRRVNPQEGQAQAYFETGIEFTGISDFDRFNINRYIKERIESKT